MKESPSHSSTTTLSSSNSGLVVYLPPVFLYPISNLYMGLSYFLPLHLIEGKIEGVIAQKLRKSWLAKLKQSFHVLRTLTIMLRELGPAAQSVVVWGINYVVTRALCITRSLINLGISSCIYILILIA